MTRTSTTAASCLAAAASLPARVTAAATAILILAPWWSWAGAAPLPADPATISAQSAGNSLSSAARAAAVPGAGGTLRLTLGEALSRARDASAHLAELRSLAAAAGAGLTGARAERLPRIDASASYTRQSDVPELRFTIPGLGTETVFPNIPDNYRGHLGLELPLYTSGRIANAVTANAQQLTAANQDLQQGRADVEQETATAYWSLVTARDSERVPAESLADYDAHLKESRDRRDVGMAASNEVLAVQVQREQAELARLQAASSAAVANANLLRLLDLPPGTRIELVEPLAEPEPSPPAPIAAARSPTAAGRASAAATRSSLWPQANLSAGYDYANPNLRILPLEPRWKSSWSVGAVISLSLFDGGRIAAAAAQIDAQADALGHRLEDLERRVRLEVTQRLLELATARQAAGVAGGNLDAARENVRVARDRYHAGVIPSSELLDAETALLRAGLTCPTALPQVRVALPTPDRAPGG